MKVLTFGEDVYKRQTLFRLKKQGVGTILISEDISELFTMCDRILVLSSHTAFGPYLSLIHI